MKTKQSGIRAKLVSAQEKGRNYGNDKEVISRYVIVDKKTERTVIDCRVYMGRSSSASAVYATLWVYGVTVNAEGERVYASGSGQAGGHGYHKSSSAIGEAISNAGFELYGSPYGCVVNPGETIDFKKRAYIGGCGDGSILGALWAIAYAVGCRDGVMVH